MAAAPARPLRRGAAAAAAVAGAALLVPLVAAPSQATTRAAARTSSGMPAVAVKAAYAKTTADREMADKLDYRSRSALMGSQFGGTVIDVTSRTVTWSSYGTRLLRPASTTKLVTATNALSVFGPAQRFTTSVRRGSAWNSVGLVGSGDPSLSSADLAKLADAAAKAVKAHGVRTVRVWVDDDIYPAPSLATGWPSSYVPTEVAPVRALVVNEHHVMDTSVDAGKVFASLLANRGLKVSSVSRAHAPSGSPVLGTVQGDRLDDILTRMLLRSDNDHAEALHRMNARAKGWSTSWTGARAAQKTLIAREGVSLGTGALYDGSGLSRSDKLSAVTLARVVTHLFDTSGTDFAIMRHGALPVAGRTGTLAASTGRYTTSPSKCAAGLVTAKTGTLDDAVALAGYTRAADGRLKAFAFLVGGKGDSLTLKRRVDNLAATVNGCY
ncbi:D-alanyl-D-alanine carboxypeptidase/D-alanyl-D-alanine-endopeptidase [Angustibacter peucedani]